MPAFPAMEVEPHLTALKFANRTFGKSRAEFLEELLRVTLESTRAEVALLFEQGRGGEIVRRGSTAGLEDSTLKGALEVAKICIAEGDSRLHRSNGLPLFDGNGHGCPHLSRRFVSAGGGAMLRHLRREARRLS